MYSSSSEPRTEPPSISIYVQRHKGLDDVVTILRMRDGSFSILYHDKDARYRQVVRTDSRGVVAYVSNLFDLIQMDDEPFHSIQFTLPTYPSVIFNLEKLTDSKIDHFMTIFKDILYNFPISNAYRG
jgi:hypothetical protein